MRPDQRIVTKLPLTELWDETGALPGERIRSVDENLIRGLMGTGQVQFIVANCGAKLNWIPMQERFEFWKAIRPQVADVLAQGQELTGRKEKNKNILTGKEKNILDTHRPSHGRS